MRRVKLNIDGIEYNIDTGVVSCPYCEQTMNILHRPSWTLSTCDKCKKQFRIGAILQYGTYKEEE